MKIVDTFKNKILIPFRLVPRNGLTPEKLAFSITIGILCGIFPVLGTTTILSILITMLFRQNLLIVQSVQWILGIAQILLIIPFMRSGAYLLDQHILHINIDQIKLAFQPGMIAGIKTLGLFHLYGILAWLILSVPLGAVSYYTFVAVFHRKNRP